MRALEPIEARTLMEEVDRYLAAVDLFRALGCEPTWQPEPGMSVPGGESASIRMGHVPSAH